MKGNLKFMNQLKSTIKSIKITSSSFIINNSEYTFKRYQSGKLNSNHKKDYFKELLYYLFHCRRNMFVAYSNDTPDFNDNRDFIRELSYNNKGNGTWESGWQISNIFNSNTNDVITVSKNGLTLWINKKYFIAENNQPIENGINGKILIPKEYCYLLPGFYMANGNLSEFNINKEGITVRLYWNISISGAPLLVNKITTQLNNFQIPFKFKILNNRSSFPRADAAVLYINKDNYRDCKNLLQDIYSTISNYILPFCPLMAKELAPGLAVAEDPNNGESYGQHRSRILANALYEAYRNNINSTNQIIDEVRKHFKDENIQLEIPHIKFGSTDDYQMLNVVNRNRHHEKK
jgi:hypothetical protein